MSLLSCILGKCKLMFKGLQSLMEFCAYIAQCFKKCSYYFKQLKKYHLLTLGNLRLYRHVEVFIPAQNHCAISLHFYEIVFAGYQAFKSSLIIFG